MKRAGLLCICMALLIIHAACTNTMSLILPGGTERNFKLDGAGFFTEGLARASIKGKWGYIDNTGRFVIEPGFDNATDFSEGLAGVKRNNKWGYIDKTGEIVIAFNYEKIMPFSDGLAAVSAYYHEYRYIDKTGEDAIYICNLSAPDNQKSDYIELDGLCECESEKGKSTVRVASTSISAFNDGVARVINNNTWGYINKSGKYLFTPVYYTAVDYEVDNTGIEPGGRNKYIEDTGRYQNDPLFDRSNDPADYFYHGTSDMCNCADKSEKAPAFIFLRKASFFREGLAAVREKGKWGFIGRSGKYTINPRFQKVSDFYEGLAAAMTGGKWGYIDKSGKYVIAPRFDEVSIFQNGAALVMTNRQYEFIDKSGTTVISPRINGIEGVSYLCEGLAAVKSKGKWGYMDKTGEYFIDPVFDKAMDFSEGFAAVSINNRWGFVDKSGKFLKIEDYVKVEQPEPATNKLDENRRVTSKAGLVLRKKPSTSAKKIDVIPLYSEVQCFKELAATETIDGITGHWTYVSWDDKSGWVFGGFLSSKTPEIITTIQKSAFKYYSSIERTKNFYSPESGRTYKDIYVSQVIGNYAVVGYLMIGPVSGNETSMPDALWQYIGGTWNEISYNAETGMWVKLLYINNDNYIDYISSYGCCSNTTVSVELGSADGDFSTIYRSPDSGYDSFFNSYGKCGKTVISVPSNITGKTRKYRFDCKTNEMVLFLGEEEE